MRAGNRGRWALVIVAAAALVFAAAAAARTHSAAAKKPIIIGWAHDSSGPMGPFDGPALAAAQIEIKKVNKKNVLGRKIVLKTCDTQKDDPTASKACADKLISQGAKIIFTTCDVDLASPVVTGGAQRPPAHDRAVHRHRPDGAEEVRQGRQARLQLRQRRAGRGLRDGPGRLESRLEDGRPRKGHGDRLLQGGRDRLQGALQAARRQDQVRDDVPGHGLRRQQRPERRHRDQRPQGRRRRHGHRRRLRLARPLHHRHADGGEQDAGPQLVGRRRDVLGRRPEPEGHELLVRDVRERVRPRSEPGREQAREAAQGLRRAGSSPDRRRSTASSRRSSGPTARSSAPSSRP